MADHSFDLFVIGAGSGGVRAARVAARHGARVAIAEEYRFGGTCVIRGCVPKKLLTYAAHFAHDFSDAQGYGWTVGECRFSWPALIAAKDREIARLEGIYGKLLADSGVERLIGRAHLAGAGEVEVAGHRYCARHVLVATGGRPLRPAFPGAELCITSEEAFHLSELPARVLIVGGGYIAVEFAGIFSGLGAQVCLAYRGEQILRGFDDEVRSHLAEEIAKAGVTLRLGYAPVAVSRQPDGSLRAVLRHSAPAPQASSSSSSSSHTGEGALPAEFALEVDAVMLATGRVPNAGGLGLEALGVRFNERGGILVDEWGATHAPGVHAVGDVTDRIALTPVAIREGAAVAETLFGGQPTRVDHSDVAHAVFSDPPVGSVGLTEGEARSRNGVLRVFKARFRPMKATLSGRDQKTFMKLVVDAASDRVLGVHMVGPDAPEIIQMAAIAVKAGLTKAQFDAAVAVHPTAAEEFVTMR